MKALKNGRHRQRERNRSSVTSQAGQNPLTQVDTGTEGRLVLVMTCI